MNLFSGFTLFDLALVSKVEVPLLFLHGSAAHKVAMLLVSIVLCTLLLSRDKDGVMISVLGREGEGGDMVMGDYILEEIVEVIGLALTVSTLSHSYSSLIPSYSDTLSKVVSLPLLSNISHASNYLSLLHEIRLQRNSSCIVNATFCIDNIVAKGGHGLVYRGRRVGRQYGSPVVDQNQSSLIFKRMHVARVAIMKCAAREIYFGKKLTPAIGGTHTARFETSFMHADDLWLVFKDEGVSLQSLMYVISQSEVGASLMKPSLLWERLRTSEEGPQLLKGLMHQIISAVAELHKRGIVHRDLKPSNIILNSDDPKHPRLLLADFSSALNEEALAEMYGPHGPSVDELTLQYAPPEVLLSIGSSSGSQFDNTALPPVTFSYDSWSIGVIFLELILGTAEVFTISESLAARVKHQLKRSSIVAADKELKDKLLLTALAEYCITAGGGEGGAVALVGGAPGCSLHEAVLQRDVLGEGFADFWGLDLIGRLLAYRPEDRIGAAEALSHAYFEGPHISAIDRSEHAFKMARDRYDRRKRSRQGGSDGGSNEADYSDSTDMNNKLDGVRAESQSKKQLMTISSIIADSDRSHQESSLSYHRELLLLSDKKTQPLKHIVTN